MKTRPDSDISGENWSGKIELDGGNRGFDLETWEHWVADLRLIYLQSSSLNLGASLGEDDSVLRLGIIELLTIL